MHKGRGTRVALLLVLGVMVAVGLLWSRSAARSRVETDAVVGPPALLDVTLFGLLKAGDTASAWRVLEAADELEPDLAWRHALALRQHIQHMDPLLVHAGRKARESLARWPAVPPATQYQALPEPAGLVPELAYLRAPESDGAFAQVFADLTSLLGTRAQSLAPAELATLAPTRRLVVAPGVELPSVPAQRVVALAPQPALEAALGLTKPARRRMQRCVLGSTHADLPLLSTTGAALPIEGELSVYPPARVPAQVIASLSCKDGEYPALFRLERAGGEPAYMFAFNVLQSFVLARQGDPAQKDHENDGVVGRRPSDLYVRELSTAQLQVPFGDLMMEAVLQLVEGDRPSLRLWHNPTRTRGVLIVTSDQDFANEDRMSVIMAALAQWKAHATFYLTSGTYQESGEQKVTAPSSSLVQLARAHGLSIGAHTYLLDSRRPAAEIVSEHAAQLRRTYQQEPVSQRFHYVRWSGYSDLPEALAAAGYAYDTSYLTLTGRYIAGLGYMTGSGLPLPYYTERGERLRVRQLATQLDDHVHPAIDTGLRGRDGEPLTMRYDALLATTKALVEGSGRHYHSPLVVNNHPLQFVEDPQWLRMLIETARVEQMAVLDVERYADFVRALTDSVVASASGEAGYRVLVQAPEQELVVRNYAGASALVDGTQRPLRDVKLFDLPAKTLTLTRGIHTLSLP